MPTLEPEVATTAAAQMVKGLSDVLAGKDPTMALYALGFVAGYHISKSEDQPLRAMLEAGVRQGHQRGVESRS